MADERRLTSEQLWDSEATLRLVDDLLAELHEAPEESSQTTEERVHQLLDELSSHSPGLSALPHVLLRAYSEITTVLNSLRKSRSVLERAALNRLQTTHEKLREVTSATEVAATDILNGLDRALELLDRLEEGGDGDGDGEASEVRAQLRDEIHQVMTHLQFQDITSQQLNYAAASLVDAEKRLGAIADLFDFAGVTGADDDEEVDDPLLDDEESSEPDVYDPAASTQGAEERQALADEIFTAGQG